MQLAGPDTYCNKDFKDVVYGDINPALKNQMLGLPAL
jgi:hypothetical protein